MRYYRAYRPASMQFKMLDFVYLSWYIKWVLDKLIFYAKRIIYYIHVHFSYCLGYHRHLE